MPRQLRATSTRMPSETDCPERLVPAARKVMGTWRSWLSRNRACTSSMLPAKATALGMSR